MDRRRLLLVALGVLALGGTAGTIAATTFFRGRDARSDVAPTREGDVASRAGPGEPRLAGAEAVRTLATDDDRIPLGEAPPGGMGVVCTVRSSPSGAPAPGIPVRLRLDAPEEAGFPPLEGTTDALGKVRFGPFPVPSVPRRLATRAAIVAEPVGAEFRRSNFFEPHIDAAAFETADPATDVRWFSIDLVTVGPTAVEGFVVTSDGRGIPDARVTTSETSTELVESVDDLVSSLFDPPTEARGAFRVAVPGPGRTHLRAVLDTWEARAVGWEEPLDVPREGLTGVRLVLEGVGRVAGRLLEADGRPAAGAEVCLTPAGTTVRDVEFAEMVSSGFLGSHAQMLRRRTGADGSFEFVGTVPNMAYDVISWETSEVERALAAAVPSGKVDLELRIARHGVRPRLVDARDGLPVYGDVRLRTKDDEYGPVHDPLRAGPNGDGLLAPAGTAVAILARARGYEDAVVRHVVSETPGLDDVRIAMTPVGATAVLRVRCVDDRDRARPWPGARFVHESTGVVVDPGQRVEGETFVTSRLRAGAYLLTTGPGAPGMDDRFRGPGALRLDVPPAGLPEVVLWRVPSGGALRLLFRATDGTLLDPGDMRSVRAKGEDDVEFQIDLFHQRADGQWREGSGEVLPYETRTLAPGTYDVTWYDRGEGGNALATVRVEVVAVSLTEVTFAMPAAGR